MRDDAIARIEAALRGLGRHHEPPVGWEARVLAKTAASPARRRGWWLLPAFALAASTLLAGPLGKVAELELVVQREARGPAVRGGSAHVGDLIHATASGGMGYRAIWVYRNEVELVVQCPGPVACRVSDDATIADLALTSLGRYTVVALTSSSALPVPAGSYDADLAAAGAAGATIRSHELDAR